MKTIYPQKQLSTADAEKMKEKRLKIYKARLNSFYDTSAKQSQGPDKKVLTAEDFKPKHDDSVDSLIYALQEHYRDSDFDPNPFSYSKLEVEDGTVCYMHRKTGSIISESTYRSLVNEKAKVYFKEPAEDKKDMVNHPPHYNVGGFEVIDIIQAFTQDLNGIAAVDTANAIKYILRWHNKNGVEDLKKARWYIDHLIKELEEFESDR